MAMRPDNYPSDRAIAVKMAQGIHKESVAKYYAALLYPYELAIDRQPVAIPNMIPIPTTTTFHVKRTKYTISSGTVAHLKFQVPTFFSKTSTGYRIPTVFTCGDYSTTSSLNWYTVPALTFHVPGSNKCRVVGAELRIRYVSKLLDQAGTIASGCTFGSNRGATYPNSTTVMTANDGALLPDLSYIHQMTWFESQNIEQDKVHRCVWLPADYNDRNFCKTLEDTSATAHEGGTHDMNWYVKLDGFTSGSTFLLEVAYIIENQLEASDDIYPRVSTVAIPSDKHHDTIIKEAMTQRNNGDLLGGLKSFVSDLWSDGWSAIKQHAPGLLGQGLSALAGILV
jgi:hypothetical protein